MLTYLLQSSTCLIIFYGIYHFILAEMTFFKYNRAYLLLSMLVSLSIPVLAPLLVLPAASVPALHWSHLSDDITYIIADSEQTTFDWKVLIGKILWAIYGVGVTVVLLKMLYGLSKIYTYYTRGQKEDFNGYQIISTDAVHLPFSFFKSIYISKHVPLKDHIHTILEHEQIHIRQWHTLDVLITEIVQAFFWFNPVMIFYKRALRQAHEFLADDIICRNNSVSNYTNLLLSKSQSGLELALTNQFFHSQIKKRIQMMTTTKTNRSATWKYALVLPILIGLIFFFSCRESQVTQDSTTETPTELKSAPISELGTYSDAEMENVYNVVEEMPRFPGCETINSEKEKEDCAKNKMLEYIYKNLKYPQEAIKAGLEGQCVVRFIVNTDGNIENIKIVRDIGGGCGQAVLNVISGMNEMEAKWISGKQGGKLVKVLYTLPVRFKLEDDVKSIGNVERKAESIDSNNAASANTLSQNDTKSLSKEPKSVAELIKSDFEILKETQINIDKTSLNQGLNVSFLSALNNHNKKTFVKGDILVSSSGISLVENGDYVVDYEKGNLRVINQSLLAGEQQLNISFKN